MRVKTAFVCLFGLMVSQSLFAQSKFSSEKGFYTGVGVGLESPVNALQLGYRLSSEFSISVYADYGFFELRNPDYEQQQAISILGSYSNYFSEVQKWGYGVSGGFHFRSLRDVTYEESVPLFISPSLFLKIPINSGLEMFPGISPIVGYTVPEFAYSIQFSLPFSFEVGNGDHLVISPAFSPNIGYAISPMDSRVFSLGLSFNF